MSLKFWKLNFLSSTLQNSFVTTASQFSLNQFRLRVPINVSILCIINNCIPINSFSLYTGLLYNDHLSITTVETLSPKWLLCTGLTLVIVGKGFLKLSDLHMLIKQMSPSLPRNFAIVGKGGHSPPPPASFLGQPPFSKICSFLEIQGFPTFYRPIRKTKVMNDFFNQFVCKLYP